MARPGQAPVPGSCRQARAVDVRLCLNLAGPGDFRQHAARPLSRGAHAFRLRLPAPQLARRPRLPPFIDPPGYRSHRPEFTLLYQLVEHYSASAVAWRKVSCACAVSVVAPRCRWHSVARSGVLPVVRSAAHGRDGCAAGSRRPARTPMAAMGAGPRQRVGVAASTRKHQ
jgi:hypothetical protein